MSFRSDIAPILLDHCLACHGPRKAEGGYRVDSYDQLFKPGDTGETPVAVAEDQQSELFRRVSTEDESERIPAESEPLVPSKSARFRLGSKVGRNLTARQAAIHCRCHTCGAPPRSTRILCRTHTDSGHFFSPDGTQLLVGGYHE